MEKKTVVFVNGPECYEAGLVGWWSRLGINSQETLRYMTFDHVLNVPSSKELWPGDAAELFFQEYFAVRLVGDDCVFTHPGPVHRHFREEILRLTEPCECITLESIWLSHHKLYCYEFNGSFANDLFSNDLQGRRPTEKCLDEEPFSDGCEDEFDEEPDTLNSELLLTEEYIGTPDSVQFRQDAVQTKLSPLRRVGTNQPTERKD